MSPIEKVKELWAPFQNNGWRNDTPSRPVAYLHLHPAPLLHNKIGPLQEICSRLADMDPHRLRRYRARVTQVLLQSLPHLPPAPPTHTPLRWPPFLQPHSPYLQRHRNAVRTLPPLQPPLYHCECLCVGVCGGVECVCVCVRVGGGGI